MADIGCLIKATRWLLKIKFSGFIYIDSCVNWNISVLYNWQAGRRGEGLLTKKGGGAEGEWAENGGCNQKGSSGVIWKFVKNMLLIYGLLAEGPGVAPGKKNVEKKIFDEKNFWKKKFRFF